MTDTCGTGLPCLEINNKVEVNGCVIYHSIYIVVIIYIIIIAIYLCMYNNTDYSCIAEISSLG